MENISLHEKILSGVVCRLCLSGDGTLIDMFSFSSELESQIAVAVTKCTSVHVEKHSKLPKTICESCYMQLVKTQNFQRQALQSEQTLQLHLEQWQQDDKQNILGSSVTHPGISGNNFLETNVAKQDREDDSTNCEEIKPEVKYFESGCEEFEMDSVEKNTDPLETRSHTKWNVQSSGKDSAFNPNLIVKSEPIINDNDLFDIDTEVLNDFPPSQNIIKSENDVSNDKIIASYQCDICKNCFNNLDILRKHQCLKYTGEKGFQCNICTKNFSCSSKLKVHQRSHTGEKPYRCDVCNKSFSQSGILRIHERVHTGEKPYKCDICNKCFTTNSDMGNHQRLHTGEKPYQCDVCNKSFSISSNLKKHQRSHTGERPYQCEVCNESFSSSSNLKKHQRSHTGEKPYQCDVCNKGFKDLSNFKSHQRVHTGEKPYQCGVCHKSFSQSGILRIHERLHTGEKPYKCDVCNKCFKTKRDLGSHQRLHTGPKLYQCDVCKKNFKDLRYFKSHQQAHTREKPYPV